jgi:Zn-dependent M28 family amino/carboxypeptidase
MRQRLELNPQAIALSLLLPLLACQAPSEQSTATSPTTSTPHVTAAMQQAAQAISAEGLRDHIARLSDDAMEGRGPGSQGAELARQHIADTLKSLGLEPGGPAGSWFQPFQLVGVETHAPDTWSFHGDKRQVTLRHSDEFMANSGVQEPEARLNDAELVFVGYGIQAPEYHWDDYKGQDMHGKVLVMLNNDPDWDPQLFAGKTRLYYGRWTYKYEIAGELGAAGAIIIHTQSSAGYPWQVVQTSWSGPQFELPDEGQPRVQVAAWVTAESARKLAELAGRNLDELVEAAHSADFQPIPLGVTTSLALDNTISHIQTANVAGLLKGSDPELSKEAVIYTAHYDHLGIGPADASGDTIYNGALDNATGVSEVLNIATAFTKLPQPPKRSVLFLLVGAEEQGLLGSEYYASHPTFPPGRIAANINIDGGDIWGKTRDITYVGYGKSTLDQVMDAMAAAQDRTVKPDQFPDRGYFYRSDQFNFAKIGVPAIYTDTGTDFIGRPEGWGKEQIEKWEATNYHQPSDELNDSWNFDGMIEDTRLLFEVGDWIADAPTMPTWNPGDEFEAARKKALAEVASGE